MNGEIIAAVILLFCNLSLLSAFLVHLVLSRREREDLYNRIMSASADEYLRLSDKSQAKENPRVNAHRRAVSAFHAQGTGIKPE